MYRSSLDVIVLVQLKLLPHRLVTGRGGFGYQHHMPNSNLLLKPVCMEQCGLALAQLLAWIQAVP